ncbi:hypothetical protein [Priestia megaterium]|jgi:hypothetical protein|uniref:hypothetical protein n=1 Tax=Priestia megaterium TaxID=1404 RepID=UPI0039DFAC4C
MLTKKTLVMLSTLTLVTTCVAFSTPTTEAAAKDAYSKKLRLKQKRGLRFVKVLTLAT